MLWWRQSFRYLESLLLLAEKETCVNIYNLFVYLAVNIIFIRISRQNNVCCIAVHADFQELGWHCAKCSFSDWHRFDFPQSPRFASNSLHLHPRSSAKGREMVEWTGSGRNISPTGQLSWNDFLSYLIWNLASLPALRLISKAVACRMIFKDAKRIVPIGKLSNCPAVFYDLGTEFDVGRNWIAGSFGIHWSFEWIIHWNWPFVWLTKSSVNFLPSCHFL